MPDTHPGHEPVPSQHIAARAGASRNRSIPSGAIILAMDSAAQQPAEHATLRSLFLDGPAGRLEALLDPGVIASSRETIRCAVALAHPHPLGGGSMHNKVVYHAARVFRDLGWPTLRFNFRGVGLSEGAHDGLAESEDFLAALDWLGAALHLPLLAAGFSFGAAMMLSAVPQQQDVAACLALGLPLHSPNQRYAYPQLADWHLPTLFLSGERDVFASPMELAAAVKPASVHARLQILPDSDHFFTGHLGAMQDAIHAWVHREILPLPARATTTGPAVAEQ